MLGISENIKELFRADANGAKAVKHLKLRFYDQDISLLFPDDLLFPSNELFPVDMEPFLTIKNDRIYTESFTLIESLCESENLTFGECNASKIEITVADITLDVTGKEFLATVEIGGYELAFGIYRVESFVRQADRRMRKITAYDRMRYFQKDVANWYNALSFPIPLAQFRNSLCEYIGVEQIKGPLPLDDMKITKTIEPQQISGLDILQAICEINGRFGHMDKTGRLKYIGLGITSLFPANDLYPSEDLYPAEMLNAEKVSHYRPKETTYEDYLVYGVDKVQIRQEEGDVGAIYGDGQNGYIIQGNFLVYGKSANELLQVAATVYDEIGGRTYRPCKITCPAFPWVEVGDGLICHTTNDIIETYSLKRTISGIQDMKDIFEATGGQKREEDFGINTQIIQIEEKTAVIKKNVEEVSVKLTDLRNYTEAQFRLTAEEIAAEVRRAREAEAALSIRADQISLSVTNLKDYTESQFRLTAEEIAAEVKRAQEAESRLSLRADGIELSVRNTKEELDNKITINQQGITAISSNGWISSRIEQDPTKIKFSANKLIVESTNFKLDGSGNATFSGHVEGASIIGGTIDIGSGLFQVEDGFGNSNAIVRIGEFLCSDEYGRGIFQSKDEKTGMSGNTSISGGLYLWAGYSREGNYAFVVNNENETRVRGSLHVSGNIYLNGSKLPEPGSKPDSWSVGFARDEWPYDWVQLTPSSWPNKNTYPQYENAKYLWWYVNVHYNDGTDTGPDV